MTLIERLISIADAIRNKTGNTGKLTLDKMVEEIEGISATETVKSLRVGFNGEYIPSGEVQGYAPIIVSVIPGDSVTRSIIDRSIKEFRSDTITSIGKNHLFYNCPNLNEVWLPNLTECAQWTFSGCTSLAHIELPSLTYLRNGMFENCTALTSVSFPAAESMDCAFENVGLTSIVLPKVKVMTGGFTRCYKLTTIDMPALESITRSSFMESMGLKALILRNLKAVTVSDLYDTESTYNKNNLFSTYDPIYKGTGYIYVPANLIDTYKSLGGWSKYASQFRALEDYTVDGTITGELDQSKI
jgi:hypothetical protein